MDDRKITRVVVKFDLDLTRLRCLNQNIIKNVLWRKLRAVTSPEILYKNLYMKRE